MLICKRPTKDLTELEVESIIQFGRIDFSKLDALIPVGVFNSWSATATDRIKFGFKYEWVNTFDNTKWHVHGHAPDPKAPSASNASNGWVVRIKHGNKWLLQSMTTPPTGLPYHWSRSTNQANHTHIPATSKIQQLGRRNSI